MKSADIRRRFLDFFASKGHRVVASHSLLPPADPTLLFVNAGMVQFKDVFTGHRDLGYVRAASSQKCLRVSGKHNDLDEVGRTPRHHTFFEMLGNFSFGDYFKADACAWAWELLTEGYGLDPNDLWITVHPEDDEARRIWIDQVGVAADRIIDDPSNFWSMGDTGPCGPCSEIHIDRGPSFKGTSMHDQGDRFMELWNLVFMQYDRDAAGKLTPLPAPSIDTGMGLERIASVLQGVRTNYDTDLFMPLINKTAEIAGVEFGKDLETDTALRVIADHARATAFLICDGVYPENEGRGYVLRRLMRRALRFGHKLGLRQPFFTEVCLEVAPTMGVAWQELEKAAPIIEKIAGQEEDRFLRTLSSGMELLESAIAAAKGLLDGETVFTLYDTHGFPVDLTAVIAEEHGLFVDHDGFLAKMEEQRARGRASWKTHTEDLAGVLDYCSENGLKSEFVGYSAVESATKPIESKVSAIFVDGTPVQEVKAGTEAAVLVQATPFYGESGGQIGDKGVITGPVGGLQVTDTKRPREDVIVHLGTVTGEKLAVGDQVTLVVDNVRLKTRRNHSATHLLHKALREVLGAHVRQRGSLVAPDRLRFDFQHTGPVTDEEIAKIEAKVTKDILADEPVVTDVLAFDQAVERGALHFFGDKYGDEVRMVSMGDSIELCGGTHVSRTGQIFAFKIVSETGVAAGVRRIEAVTGDVALALLQANDRLVQDLGRLLKTESEGLIERIKKMLADEKALRKELADAQVKAASGGALSNDKVVEVNGIKVTAVVADGMDSKAMRELSDIIRSRVGSGLVLLTRREDEKLNVVLAATKDIVDRAPANRLLGDILKSMGGKGGGNPELAMGGISSGGDPQKILDSLIAALR
ncbi:MAG TPA: alanine--tRNA ligase [Myxococcota bacterium]|nr:alanine--tRNA ligase [Myxococcota bacterium]HON24526.1 alanine--tRNA ligase [Myxococcota bacterium]HOS61721.1 alanine--tRNA ligase [Myxococcota bacterium]HPC90923.1 alanine--tRNA ligase [Myxococcota bacterium]HPL24763.1 alanine--tRNA ligase [Myxococcota bacterium]